MNRALTDLEFMAYEAVLYLRFLSEDYPFLTARRPKLEEWLRQLRTDGPDSEGKRSCQVPEQALKLLEDAEAIPAIERRCAAQPFGDGKASLKIAETLKESLLN